MFTLTCLQMQNLLFHDQKFISYFPEITHCDGWINRKFAMSVNIEDINRAPKLLTTATTRDMDAAQLPRQNTNTYHHNLYQMTTATIDPLTTIVVWHRTMLRFL
jgi:hypothetical protein